MAEAYWSGSDTDDVSSLVVAAVMGDRDRANEIAARIDAQPVSVAALGGALFTCSCGAVFDIEAAPNYKARIEEAEFPWPSPTAIDYPTKLW